MYKVGCKLRWYNFSHAVTWWLLLIAIWIFTKRSQTRTVNRDLFIAQSIIIAADPQCGYVFLYKIDLSSLSTLLLQNGRWKEKQKKKKKTFTEVEKKLQRNCFFIHAVAKTLNYSSISSKLSWRTNTRAKSSFLKKNLLF